MFGPLLTSDRHAILWAARLANPVGSKKPETPSVVGLVSSSPRFLPLPLVSQRSSSIETNPSTIKSTESSAKGDTSSVNQVFTFYKFNETLTYEFLFLLFFRKKTIKSSRILQLQMLLAQLLPHFSEQSIPRGVPVFLVETSKNVVTSLLIIVIYLKRLL